MRRNRMTTRKDDDMRWTVTFDMEVFGDRDPREWDWSLILRDVNEGPDSVIDFGWLSVVPSGG